jgi:hypothetical protein
MAECYGPPQNALPGRAYWPAFILVNLFHCQGLGLKERIGARVALMRGVITLHP